MLNNYSMINYLKKDVIYNSNIRLKTSININNTATYM